MEEEDSVSWTKERRVFFNLRCLATCDNNIAFLATATTCPISTPNTISRSQTRRRIRTRAATRPRAN
jgi:hypothetical protein